jgi:putative transposase
MSNERAGIVTLVSQACDSGATQESACNIIGISSKTFQRWTGNSNKQDGRLEPKHSPNHKLTELERQRIIKVVNEPEYSNLPPCQIVPRLADTGVYIASEASFYRVLNEHNQLKHRQKSKPARQVNKPRALTATAPNKIYSWDITYLPTQVKGIFLYLYLVIDIYSRKIVGWQTHHEELSALAANLMTDICQREQVKRNQVTLHLPKCRPRTADTSVAGCRTCARWEVFAQESFDEGRINVSELVLFSIEPEPEMSKAAQIDPDGAIGIALAS